MATNLLLTPPDQIIDLLKSVSLNAADIARIESLGAGLVDASLLPRSVLGPTPTWPQLLAWLSDPLVNLNEKIPLTRAIAVASDGGLLTSFTAPPDSHPPNPGATPSDMLDWVRNAARGYFEEVYDNEANAAKFGAIGVHEATAAKAVVVNILHDTLVAFIGKVGDYLSAGTPIAARLAAHTINQISGTNIDEDKIESDFAGSPSREAIVDIGAQFGQVLDKMFPIGPTAEGEKDRANRQFARDNVNAYFGTNLNFQLRSLAIGTVASLFPGFELRQFENLHQSINWAYGFGWLSWTVLSAVMGVTTTKPLTEYYNAKIKGNDFTEQQAINAFLEKHIDEGTLNKILDNHGIRDDIRATKIEMDRKGLTTEQAVNAFIQGKIDAGKFNSVMDRERIREDERKTKVDLAKPDLTESDIQEGYNNGLLSESDGRDHYTEKGFDGFNLQAKVDLLKDQRLFALQKQLASTMHHHYVLGTVDQAEYVQYLNSIHYNQLEVDVELKRAEIEMRSHLQKHLTRAEILRLVADGSMQASDGLARLKAMGLPDDDARRLLADAVLRHAVSMIPSKIRDACLGPQVEQNLLSAAITTAVELDPLYAIQNKDFFAQARCILESYGTPSGGGGGGTQPPPVVPPIDLSNIPPFHDLIPTLEDNAFACKVVQALKRGQAINDSVINWMLNGAARVAVLDARSNPACV